MRIAYVALYLDRHIIQGGVGEKITAQLNFWRKSGHDSSLYYLTPDNSLLEGANAFRYQSFVQPQKLKSLSRYISRSIAMMRLLVRLRENQPELIYLRHGWYVFPLHLLFNFAPVVIEYNSNDVGESKFQGRIFYWFNRFTRGLLLEKAAGIIYLSHELAFAENNATYHKPSIVISNGIDLERNPLLPPTDNILPVITFVGSPGMSWHGVDKLIGLAVRFPDLVMNIVGYQTSDFGAGIPENVRIPGFLRHEQVLEVLMRTDVACGTLALHRKNMHEASPLKVREAVSCGLPVILGYRDTDLNELECEYILRLPNTEENVESHAEQIRSFAYRMTGKRMNLQMVRERIDLRRKEKMRLDFLAEIFRIHTKKHR